MAGCSARLARRFQPPTQGFRQARGAVDCTRPLLKPITGPALPKKHHCPEYQLGAGDLLRILEQGNGLVRLGFKAPTVNFARWLMEHDRFAADSDLADESLVKFTINQEKLSQTMEGSAARLQTEPRAIFDVKGKIELGAPDHFLFFREEYLAMRNAVLPLVRKELSVVAPWVMESSLGNCIMRHSVYPPYGVCGAHTDYGLCTVQLGKHRRLEVELDGAWRFVPDSWILYAGDMMEVLTNGRIPAVKHRVHADANGGQSHVFFVQPSNDDVVQPASAYVSEDTPTRSAIVYKHWHEKKKRAAFAL